MRTKPNKGRIEGRLQAKLHPWLDNLWLLLKWQFSHLVCPTLGYPALTFSKEEVNVSLDEGRAWWPFRGHLITPRLSLCSRKETSNKFRPTKFWLLLSYCFLRYCQPPTKILGGPSLKVTHGQPSTNYGRMLITILAIFCYWFRCVEEFSEITVSCVWVVAMCGVAWSCYVWLGVELLCVVWEPTWLWSQQRRRALKL